MLPASARTHKAGRSWVPEASRQSSIDRNSATVRERSGALEPLAVLQRRGNGRWSLTESSWAGAGAVGQSVRRTIAATSEARRPARVED